MSRTDGFVAASWSVGCEERDVKWFMVQVRSKHGPVNYVPGVHDHVVLAEARRQARALGPAWRVDPDIAERVEGNGRNCAQVTIWREPNIKAMAEAIAEQT